jgi:hypothetical protein
MLLVAGELRFVDVFQVWIVDKVCGAVSGSGAEDAASISVALSASDIDGTIASYIDRDTDEQLAIVYEKITQYFKPNIWHLVVTDNGSIN